jgi:salicylate hydroxylase
LLPFLAQGGACAIEDAAVLSARIDAAPGDLPGALRAFETIRRPRAAALQDAGRANGRIYHMPEPLALARDFVMRRMGGEGLMNRYAWLYEWTPSS